MLGSYFCCQDYYPSEGIELLVAAVLLCFLQKRSLAEQSNPVQGKTVELPLNHSVALLLFCVCYMTGLKKIICLCHFRLAGRR